MDYVNDCKEMLKRFIGNPREENDSIALGINIRTKKLLDSNKRIVLCGFTPLAKHFARVLENNYKEVVIADEEEFGISLEGTPVIAYDKIEEHKNALFIICSRTIIDKHIRKIPTEYHMLSWHHLLFLDSAYDFNKYDFTHKKLQKQFEDVIQNASRYMSVLDELADEVSKDLLAKILLFRISFDLKLNLGVGSRYIHYFDKDVISLSDHESFVDGGGYTGDTLEQFLELTNRSFDHYYLFEPEQELMKKAREVSTDPRVRYYMRGLYDENKTVRFKIGSEGSGTVSSEGELTVELSKLDDLIHTPVTYIKMDIEGSELAALRGASKTIEAYKPKLAICIYHKYEDILEIYDFIRRCCSGAYKIYMRAEKDNLDQQIVFYAVYPNTVY